MSAFSDLLRKEFGPYGELTQSEIVSLEAHYALLLRWNLKINLTRITTLDDAVRLHYCESLYIARFFPKEVPATKILRVADMGSGGGFPGIPLSIIRPDCSVDLIESDQRKAVFLSESSRDLSNVRVIAKRAAEIQDRYDLVVSRAVSSQDVLASGLAPRYLILGAEGQKLPWGDNRRIRIVDVPRGTSSSLTT